MNKEKVEPFVIERIFNAPTDIVPEFKKENFVAGWTDIIGRALSEYLEKNK